MFVETLVLIKNTHTKSIEEQSCGLFSATPYHQPPVMQSWGWSYLIDAAAQQQDPELLEEDLVGKDQTWPQHGSFYWCSWISFAQNSWDSESFVLYLKFAQQNLYEDPTDIHPHCGEKQPESLLPVTGITITCILPGLSDWSNYWPRMTQAYS